MVSGGGQDGPSSPSKPKFTSDPIVFECSTTLGICPNVPVSRAIGTMILHRQAQEICDLRISMDAQTKLEQREGDCKFAEVCINATLGSLEAGNPQVVRLVEENLESN